ncbi:MDR family MFS transporter [Psychroserpens mesophilus]|uniref:MDR family MFS transporter n=1 Tax=Psychroserpens mesophilus TaxID=325473 RepID=UPI0005909B78|nr:MFS transporter [Psychroserpens mesophilus]
MKSLFNKYIDTYKGIAREIWFLSIVTFINRAGAMVIPFLSLYLINQKGFTLPQVGWIMTFYGFGSLVGNLIGGKLTDIIGYYKTIVLSLFTGGLGFIGIQFLDTFYSVCFGMFFLMIAVDIYRPAIFVAADAYSINNNVTRNIGLIRLAINLGFSIGPVIGGILIARVSYSSIFWVDGITCILASFLLIALLKPKKKKNEEMPVIQVKEGISPYRNPAFLLFFLVMIINAIAFIQYFSTVPIYYKQIHGLSEDTIGSILFLNGIMIVFLEMPLIAWVERLGMSKITATILGIVFLALSFIILNFSSLFGVLIIGMVLMTIGEMIGSPFSNALALKMAPKGRKGSYMGLYSMSFSISHIIGHNAGMNAIHYFDFDLTWYGMFFILIVAAIIIMYLPNLMKKQQL